LRLVSKSDFRYLAYGLIFAAACAHTGRRADITGRGIPTESILNLRLIGAYGPAFDGGISFLDPSGAAINGAGEIFISDRGANAVYGFSPSLDSVSEQGGIGAAPGTFNRPAGLACDQALNLYVSDSGNRRIQILDRNLRYVKTVDSYFDQNDEPLKFTRPEDIKIDREGNFWVADNDKILKLDPFYELLLEMSYSAPGNFRIGRVSSIDISNSDLVAIGDPGNGQVIIATMHGNHVIDFAVDSPLSVAWDDRGLLWVAEGNAGKLEVFDVDGNLRYRFSENTPGYNPSWITFDSAGRLLVLESRQRRVFIYEIIRGS